MELRTYLEILWRRKWVIVITTVVTVLVTAAGVFMMVPIYEASTTLRIAPIGTGVASYAELTYAAHLRNSIAQFVKSDRVLDELAQRLGLDQPPQVITEMLGNTELMRLTVRDPDPRLAQEAADTAAQILMELYQELYVKDVVAAREALAARLAQAEGELDQAMIEYESISAQSPDSPLETQAAVELDLKQQAYSVLLERYEEAQANEAAQGSAFTVFTPADFPEAPAGLPKALYVALGFAVGLTAGAGLAFLFENLDSTLHTAERIEVVTHMSSLGRIPTAGRRQPLFFSNGRSLQEEAFRRLRTNLLALDGSAPWQTLLVTSAEPQEGKTTIVANLAYALAESGRQVVAVDCDLRRPRLHTISNSFVRFNLTNEFGLSSVLHHQTTLDAALQATEIPGLQVLCAGPWTSKPAELLGSPAMADLLGELRQRFDLVLLDTPAIAAVADAAILAPLADGVLLVVRRGKAREAGVRAACQQLADVGARPVGIVVNGARQEGGYHYYQRPERAERAPVSDT